MSSLNQENVDVETKRDGFEWRIKYWVKVVIYSYKMRMGFTQLDGIERNQIKYQID